MLSSISDAALRSAASEVKGSEMIDFDKTQTNDLGKWLEDKLQDLDIYMTKGDINILKWVIVHYIRSTGEPNN
jgi:hypothetical protein